MNVSRLTENENSSKPPLRVLSIEHSLHLLRDAQFKFLYGHFLFFSPKQGSRDEDGHPGTKVKDGGRKNFFEPRNRMTDGYFCPMRTTDGAPRTEPDGESIDFLSEADGPPSSDSRTDSHPGRPQFAKGGRSVSRNHWSQE